VGRTGRTRVLHDFSELRGSFLRAFIPGPNAIPLRTWDSVLGTGGRTGGTRRGTRLTQREAAERLGVSVEAIRKRVARGTLRSDKGEDGRRYVYLDTDPDAGGPQPEPDALTSELRDRLRYVEQQLEAERQAHAEARRLLMAALERIPPQIEAPRESPETAREEPERAEPHPATVESQESVQRPWWRRVFGR
jgi:hypothetical protein